MKNKFFRHAGLDPVSSGFKQLDSGLRRNDKAGLRFTINKQHFSILEAVMNACLTTTGLMQRFSRLFGVLVLSLFSFQVMAAETPVVSVDHRVTASFSKPQFDPKKGGYTSEVRIKNRSAAPLLSPLRLTLEKFDGKDVKPLNALGVGMDGRPYYEFTLPKGMLIAGGMTDSIKVVFAVDKAKDIRASTEPVAIKTGVPAYIYHVSAGVEFALLRPNAAPSDLPANSGKQTVRFSVPLVGKINSTSKVYLRIRGGKENIAMNDLGRGGDVTAKDGTYGVDLQINTDKVMPDTCVQYEAFVRQGNTELSPSTVQLCVSSFPMKMAESNIVSPAVFPDGSKAVADEILLTVTPSTTAAAIRELASSIHAKVVGSYMTLNLYQLKLPTRLNANQLLEIASQVKAHAGVVSASINAIGGYAYTPDDTAFNLSPTDITSQHGLKLVLAHNQATGANAWDSTTKGAGVTVVVMDSGLDLTHPDLGPSDLGDPAWSCQSGVCTDTDGHGTQVAGVIAAKTHNAQGIAGVAFKSKIHSIQVSTNANVTAAQMIPGFTAARDYVAVHPGVASVINASFYAAGGSATAADWKTVCGLIEQTVFSGVARAVVVNAVGNSNMNGYIYPARCKDLNPIDLPHPDLLIAVSSSISIDNTMPSAPAIDPLCLPLDAPLASSLNQRCHSSNFGAWVDIAAPGSSIRTTSIGSSYVNSTGNSFSAPFVAGAAAILNSCGISPSQIKSTLTSSAIVTVQYPAYGANLPGSTPRIDISRALNQVNHAPTGVSPAINSIDENSPNGTLISTLSKNDVDTCDKFTYSITGANPGGFTLDANTGELRVGGVALDYEALPAPHSYALTVRVTDFFGLTFDQPVTVNVNNLNDTPPVITSNGGGATATVSVPENSTAVTTVTATDADNLGPLTYSIAGGADASEFTINSSTGALSFGTPPNFEAATDSDLNNIYDVIVQASDGTFTDTQAIAVTVTNVNEAPVANNDTLAATQNTPVTYAGTLLFGNDTDEDAGTTFSITGLTSGVGGTVVPNGTGVTFTPNPGFTGPASFTYRASDGSLLSNVATVTVNVSAAVNHAPVATADVLAATEDNPKTYAAALLLGNDTDVDAGTTLTVASVTSGAGGTVVLNGDGTVTFSPNSNFNGPANFTYQATDGGLTSNVATVTVNVAPVNDVSTGGPYITGTRTVGQTLTANTLTINLPNPIADADGLGTFSYQWSASGSPVGGNSDTYVLTPADFGKFMMVCVSFTDAQGTLENSTLNPSLCSAADSTAVGDPHITTVDGLHYDFQGAGEFVALRGSTGMQIQLRMAAVSTAPPFADSYTGLTSGVSVITAVAARVGKHRVTYQPDTSPNAAGGTFVLRVDGVPTTLPVDGIDLGDGGRVISQASGIQIDFPDQTTLMINSNSGAFYGAWWLHINVFHTSALDGIMGARSNGSWLPRLSNGSALGAMPAALHKRYVELYVKFADSWRVNRETSLFDYDKDTSTATFTNKAWPTENGPYDTGIGPVAKPLGLKAAQLACRNVVGKNEKADCVFDVRVMGNADIAKGHVLTQKIRTGLTAIILNDDRDVAKEMVTFTATVARHAAITRMEFAGKGERGVPTGTVQFTINGNSVGRPVKLDARGQAQLQLPRRKIEKQTIGAKYIPVKGGLFFPSSSRQLMRELAPLR